MSKKKLDILVHEIKEESPNEEQLMTQEGSVDGSNEDLKHVSVEEGRHFTQARIRAKAKSNMSMNAKKINGKDIYRIEQENIRIAGKLMNVKPTYNL